MNLSYQKVYTMNKTQARDQLVQTARLWQTSRAVVRQWVRRFQSAGQAGLQDRSRRPHSCPRRTPAKVEERVVRLRHQTGYGRQRLSRILWQQQRLQLSPNTIRHILKRHGLVQPRRRRKVFCYPAHWAWRSVEVRPLLKKMLHLNASGKRKGPLPWLKWM